jgi:quinol monooxygenase YgiN
MLDASTFVLQKYGIELVKGQQMPVILPDMTRVEMAHMFRELNLKVGAEIGVESGEFSASLVKHNPGLRLYCIDAWKPYEAYRNHVGQPKFEQFYERAKARLAPHDCVIIRKLSMAAVKDFEDETLDFVYIDGNHDFQFVVNDLVEWAKKVKKGGVVAGHDYFHSARGPFHVIEAVQGYTAAYRVPLWFVLKGDKSPSFFWVK